MKNLEDFIASGILELYILGDTSDEEDAEVLIMSSKFPAEIAGEILAISTALENLALENAVEPSARLKESLFAKITEMAAQGNGAQSAGAKPSRRKPAVSRAAVSNTDAAAVKSPRPVSEIPPLTYFSKIEDYTDWFSPADLIMPAGFKGRHLKLLGHTPEMTTLLICATAIEGEVHYDEYERLLVIEGTCDIIIENKVFSFHKGDLINIPLNKWHDVIIPEGTVCKAILQRIPVQL
jgi:mannose-6-phosphate isomerase-like protein (cupin superfamily)